MLLQCCYNVVLLKAKPRERPAPSATPLLVKSFCLNIEENSVKHRTNFYNISNGTCSVGKSPSAQNGEPQAEPQLVVRRGDTFTITIDFNQPYNKDSHELFIQLQIGTIRLPMPMVYKHLSLLTKRSLYPKLIKTNLLS
jgi:hypothetical protein